MVTITIDNQQIEVPEGTTVLNAARSAGIHIPTLCDHPHLTPYGGCRLCMVEIEGFRTLQSACTIPVTNNMVVRTRTDSVNAARKFVLTLIFSERNHFCPYCQVSGGDCELQNAAYGEGMTHWPLQPNWQPYPVDASHPYIILEHNRCILCRRCIRACSELVGVNTLGVEERGAKTFVIADLNVPLGESSCVSCGSCVQVCPTGAIIDRRSAYRAQGSEVEHHLSVCVGCSLGCGIDILTRDGQVVRIDGDWESDINGGVLCKVGRFEPLYDDRERITTPMIRKDGRLQPTSWDEALDTVAAKFKSAIGQADNSVVALASTRLPIESLHVFKQLFKDGCGSTTVTTLEEGANTRLASEFASQVNAPFEGGLDAIRQANSILLFGADLVKSHEVAGFLARRILPDGTSLIVVDSQDNPLGFLANCMLKPTRGCEKALLAGLTAAVAKLGQNKVAYNSDPDAAVLAAAQECGVASDLLLEAACKLAAGENPVIVFDPVYVKDLATLRSLADLAKTCGAVLVDSKGGANSLAAAQFGLDQPFRLNGQQFAFVALADDTISERMLKSLEAATFLVVQASHASKLTAQADVVLPVTNWVEQDGHYLSMDGRLQRAVSALQPREGIRTNTAVLTELAQKMGIRLQDDWKSDLTQRPSPVEIAA